MEERTQLRANATPNAQGLFEVVLITAGQGNGWNFSAQVLEDSVKLWDGCECFVDHAGAMQGGQSLRNLCGVFYDVTFDEQVGGVRAKLKTLGPSGPLAAQLGKEWLAEQEPRPAVGFSADIGFIASSTTPSNTTHAQGREVLQITRVYSCDMVFEPARGGTFVRALNGTPGIAVLRTALSPEPPFSTNQTAAQAATIHRRQTWTQNHCASLGLTQIKALEKARTRQSKPRSRTAQSKRTRCAHKCAPICWMRA